MIFYRKEIVMNKDIIEGNWKQMKGAVQQKWGDLTDDQFDQINGSRKKLIGQVQESYGKTRDQAEKEVKEWEKQQKAA
jgi:uncharacterized protein YjbJ (UPF0337 family)